MFLDSFRVLIERLADSGSWMTSLEALRALRFRKFSVSLFPRPPCALYCSVGASWHIADFADVWSTESLEGGHPVPAIGQTFNKNPKTIQKQVSFAWENVSRGFMRAVTIFKIWKFSEILNFLLCRPVQTRIQVWTGYPGGCGQQRRHRL